MLRLHYSLNLVQAMVESEPKFRRIRIGMLVEPRHISLAAILLCLDASISVLRLRTQSSWLEH